MPTPPRKSTWTLVRDTYGETLGAATNRAREAAMADFAGLDPGERDFVIAQLLYYIARGQAEVLTSLRETRDALSAHDSGADGEADDDVPVGEPSVTVHKVPPAPETPAAASPGNGPATTSVQPTEVLDASGTPVA